MNARWAPSRSGQMVKISLTSTEISSGKGARTRRIFRSSHDSAANSSSRLFVVKNPAIVFQSFLDFCLNGIFHYLQAGEPSGNQRGPAGLFPLAVF
jgi:hypothetical protein